MGLPFLFLAEIDDNKDIQISVVGALVGMAATPRYGAAMVASGAVKVAGQLAGRGDSGVAFAALKLLLLLAQDPGGGIAVATEGGVECLVSVARKADAQVA